MKGLEPPRPETLDPKSNAATNYATRALKCCKGTTFFNHSQESDTFFYDTTPQ